MASRSVRLELDDEAQDAIVAVGQKVGTTDLAGVLRICLGGYAALLHHLDSNKGSKLGLILENGEYIEIELCNEASQLEHLAPVIPLFPLEESDREVEKFLDEAGEDDMDEMIDLPPLAVALENLSKGQPSDDDLLPEVTQEKVDEALNNALASDYDYRHYKNYEALAIDIGTYCADLEGAEPEQLIPLIKDWQARHS